MATKETMITEFGKGTKKATKVFYTYDVDEIKLTKTSLLSIRTEGSSFIVAIFGGKKIILGPNEDRDMSKFGLYVINDEKTEIEDHHVFDLPWEMYIYKEGKSLSSSSTSSSFIRRLI